jgi:hypothetical protein
MNAVRQSIAEATRGTRPRTAARMRALAQVRWVLATDDGRFVRVNDCAHVSLVGELNGATVYDGRDNEELKTRFMTALLGEPVSVVLLDPEI